MNTFRALLLVLCPLIRMLAPAAAAASSASETNLHPIRIGSKAFTESVILAEMATHLAAAKGLPTEHVAGLGGTRILWEALLAGQIDLYPEYTGTMSEEIFSGEGVRGDRALRARLASQDLRMTRPLGFNNTYAIGMREELAAELDIHTIGDLREHPGLILRFSNEFMKRADGWDALASHYELPHADVRGLEHALAYEALEKGVIQVTDLYSTDAKIRKLRLRKLRDELGHFPTYFAVFLYRVELEEQAPQFIDALRSLEGAIDAGTMIELNARVELEDRSESSVAAQFLADSLGIAAHAPASSLAADLLRFSTEHLQMVGVSLTTATLLAIPLGVLAVRRRRFAQPILGVVGVIQTIPSIALLVLLIRPVSYVSDELGYPQAVIALFLYSLLPIVRNTYAGLQGIPAPLLESAVALGLPARVRLLRIELPLASRTILAGVKTAAVLNVGFATLGGFIGAGGFGEPIFTGIRLNDYGVILQGAVPAALLALLVQGLFEIIDRMVVPKGLRIKPAP
jgi:osmoprotectant transport system permease protein